MPEAITKYAVNSTLGTDEFQPLDIYMRNLFAKMKRLVAKPESSENLLFSKTALNPSENDYIKLNGKYYIGEFSSYIGGEIFLRFIPQGNIDLFPYLKFTVYKDGVLVNTYNWELKDIGNGLTGYQFSGNLKIEPFSIYKFYLEGVYNNSGSMAIYNIVSSGYASIEDWHSYDFDFEDNFIEEG